MDFAPYQDTAPERTRALSPPRDHPPPSHPTTHHSTSPSRTTNTLPAPSHFTDEPDDLEANSASPPFGGRSGVTDTRAGGGGGGGGGGMDLFTTSLPLRLDHEACLAYLCLPPAGGVILLILEHKSDYVRFHAWQSSLVFTVLFIIHLIFSWSRVLSWLLLVFDAGLIAFLTGRAYRDANTLDRCELPFFGGLASSFVDAE